MTAKKREILKKKKKLNIRKMERLHGKGLVSAVKYVFLTEVPDNILLGEVKAAMSSPKRRDRFRRKLIRILFINNRATRNVAKIFGSTRSPWMSEVAHAKIKRAVATFNKQMGSRS